MYHHGEMFEKAAYRNPATRRMISELRGAWSTIALKNQNYNFDSFPSQKQALPRKNV
ncbi:MAG: hypothetical protein GY820_19865 [Gammaproteobacteria bacterium]|nr:hypothetical protein [Gammaproteobacteria bacterium]